MNRLESNYGNPFFMSSFSLKERHFLKTQDPIEIAMQEIQAAGRGWERQPWLQ